MNQQIPSIYQLLEEIDPDKTIDREKAMGEITSVAILKTITEFVDKADVEIKVKIKTLLDSSQDLNKDALFKLISDAGKMDDFLKILNKNIDFIRLDYIKTHLAAISVAKKEELFSKYPTLRDVS